MIIDEDAYIQHYGVKGMKWGIRKNYTNKLSKRAKRYDKIGLKGSARQTREAAERIERGEARTRDLIGLYGTTTIFDLRRARRLVRDANA